MFSAILTAFNVQSYQLLTPSPSPDPVILALERISAQLGSFAVTPPSINSTQPAFIYHDSTPSSAPRYAIWLNTLWFSSLIFSLSSASIGIMVKQWLNEYKSGLSGKSRQISRLRQLRLNSLHRWRVKEIVAILPVLLQIASALFFAGLLVLLWHLNDTVAFVSTILVGFLVMFSLCTIVLPSIATDCSYLSPPSRALYELTRPLRKLVFLVSSWMAHQYCGTDLPLNSSMEEKFQRKHPHMYTMWKLLRTKDHSSTLKWGGKELYSLTLHAPELDGDTVATAYTTGMNVNYLHQAAVCSTELGLDAARRCFVAIRSANITHWGADEHAEPMQSVHPCMWSGAIIALMNALSTAAEGHKPPLLDALVTMYQSMGFISNQHVSSALGHTRLVSVDFERIIRHYNITELPGDMRSISELILSHDLLRLTREVLGVTLLDDCHPRGKC